MPMSREQWLAEVRPHLDFIEAGAMMIERHAKDLMVRPDWETTAEVELEICSKALWAALARIERARTIYQGKELDA